ncbi:sugar MFS transporter [Geitlerinema sp. PCC 7407]|uniref:MFS transporter n=1 Tax=Geitlerinema sp. PCC 7407 TaxID=1173025 RepID=UPI00029FFF14|nr:MFS transporter [Geitlerinema sp. PCC 7407]AFY65237.1 major facilitator superfamily MFS_1 [Geitlerinema sp. PCC 7407]
MLVSRGRLTAMSFVGLFLHGLVVAMPGAFLLQWQAAFGTAVNLGAYYALFVISSVAGLYWNAQRDRRHPWLSMAFGLIGVALLGAALVPGFWGIAIAALPIGFADSVVNLQSNSLVGELHPKRRVVLLNWANATFGVGALTAPLLGALLPWRVALGAIALVALGCGALAWQAPPVENFVPARDRMPWRRAAPILGVVGLYVGLEGVIGTWSGTYLKFLGWSDAWSSGLLSLYWGGLTLGRVFLSPWISRQPMARLPWLLLAGAIALGLTLVPSLAPLMAIAAIFYGPTFATLFAKLQEDCGHVALSYLFYVAYISQMGLSGLFSWVPHPSWLPLLFTGFAVLLWWSSGRLALGPDPCPDSLP